MSSLARPFASPNGSDRANVALSEGQIADLRELHEAFARDLGTALSALTRRRVSVEVETLERVAIEDWEHEIAKARFVISLRADPLAATVLVALDGATAFGLLEGLLGAGLSPQQGPQRDLTDIELAVLQTLHPVMLNEMGRAWERIGRCKLQVMQHGRGVRRSQLGGFGSHLIAVRMEVEIDQTKGVLLVALPMSMKPVDESANAPESERAVQKQRRAIFERLQGSNLELEATIEGSTIRLADLLDLRAGDILRLDNALKQPVAVRVNGGLRFQGRFVAAQKRRSLLLEDAARTPRREGGGAGTTPTGAGHEPSEGEPSPKM